MLIKYDGIGTGITKNEFTKDELLKLMDEQFTYKKLEKGVRFLPTRDTT
jgi:hypothetical protein